MPSQICHTLAGRMALEQSAVQTETPFFLSGGLIPAAFNLGCQGPDIFSHNRRTRPFALAYSRLLHRKNYGRFCGSLALLIRENPSPVSISWFYGFVTHQAVDRSMHPYIVNRSFVSGSTGIPGVTPAQFHAFFERILDVCLLRELGGVSISNFDTGNPFSLSPEEISPISDVIARALAITYPPDGKDDSMFVIEESRMRTINAFSDAMYFYRMTNPISTDMNRASRDSTVCDFADCGMGGVALLFPQDIDPLVDWLNTGRTAWRHPASGELFTSSASDLFHEAVQDASRIIALVPAVLDGSCDPDELERAAGNDCLSVSGPDGRIAPVLFSDPFDLGKYLKIEAEKRKKWLSSVLC